MLITLDNGKKIEVSTKLAIMPGHSSVLSVARVDDKHRYILFSTNAVANGTTFPVVKITTDQMNQIFSEKSEIWLTRKGMHQIAGVKEHKKLPKDNFWWSMDSKIKFGTTSIKLTKCEMIDEDSGDRYNDKFVLSNEEFNEYVSAVVGPKISKNRVAFLIQKGKSLLDAEELIDIDQIVVTPKVAQP
jgi:hypothetical protein